MIYRLRDFFSQLVALLTKFSPAFTLETKTRYRHTHSERHSHFANLLFKMF